MIRDIQARIDRSLARIRQAFRGVTKTVNAAPAVQLVQVDGLDGETLQAVELIQQYGFTSNPPAGSMAVLVPLGGKTAHGIIIATEHGTYRLKNLAPGEMALYTDEDQEAGGHRIILKRGQGIELHAGASSIVMGPSGITITTPSFDLNEA